MDLRQLEAFAAVLSSGSVTAAAKALDRSQPVVSRLLQELEADLGYALFTRHGPRVAPTEAAFLLNEDLAPLLANMRVLRLRAHEIGRRLPRPLRLAATYALAAGLLPAALARRNPDLIPRVSLLSMTPERVLHAVLTSASPLGVVSLPRSHRGLRPLWTVESSCVLALPEGDALAALDVVPLSACRDRELLVMASPYRLRQQQEQALIEAGVAPDRLHVDTNASVNALAAVHAGLGLALVEPVSARGLPLRGVAVRPIDRHIPYAFSAVVPAQAEPSEAVLRFAGLILDTARALLPALTLLPTDDPALEAC